MRQPIGLLAEQGVQRIEAASLARDSVEPRQRGVDTFTQGRSPLGQRGQTALDDLLFADARGDAVVAALRSKPCGSS